MMAEPKLVDMKRSKPDEEAGEYAMPAGADGSQYPYGLCISLEGEDLRKLGISKMPAVGTELHMIAVGMVTSANQPVDDPEEARISIQITMMQAAVEKSHPGEESETVADEDREMRKGGKGALTILDNAYRAKE